MCVLCVHGVKVCYRKMMMICTVCVQPETFAVYLMAEMVPCVSESVQWLSTLKQHSILMLTIRCLDEHLKVSVASFMLQWVWFIVCFNDHWYFNGCGHQWVWSWFASVDVVTDVPI